MSVYMSDMFAKNRAIVMAGLNRRAEMRADAEMDAKLDQYESEMLQRINENCNRVAFDEMVNGRVYDSISACNGRIRSREIARQERQKRTQAKKDIVLGGFVFATYSLFFLWLERWTYLPMYAAITMIICGSFFLDAYIRKTINSVKKG